MKKILKCSISLAFALIMLLAMTTGATALEKSTYRETSVAAAASWTEETPDIQTSTFLSVVEMQGGTIINLSVYTYSFSTDVGTYKWGHLFTTEEVFDMGKKLSDATLSPVRLDLFDTESEPVGTITIQAEWTTSGGDTLRESYKNKQKSENYKWESSNKAKSMQATATGFIDEQALGPSDWGQLFASKYRTMEKEK